MIARELALMWGYAWGVPNEKENAMNDTIDATDLLDTLKIAKTERRTIGGGTWASGTMGGHRLDALVFPDHADEPTYELANSRISKLSLQRISDGQIVANFDRGWDVRPTTTIAGQIVDLLAAGLAETVYSG